MSMSAIDYFGLYRVEHKQVNSSSYHKLFVSLKVVNCLSEAGVYNKL